MRRYYFALLLLGLAAVVLVIFVGTAPDEAPEARAAQTSDDTVIVGGVRRPATDVMELEDPPPAEPKFDYGVVQPIAADANEDVASLAEALQGDEHPERLSVMARPAPFDRQAYRADPQTHLHTVEPGRVLQPAQPAEGVTRLEALSPRLQRIDQGQSVTLSVRAEPEMPVTYTSFDLGAFENLLTTITVAADERGVATVSFTGTPGTYNDVNILAASPTASGRARFIVRVTPPKAEDSE